MRSKVRLIVDALCRAWDKIKAVRAGEVVGIAILAFAAWVYLGEYVEGVAVCSVAIGEGLFADGSFKLNCLDSVLGNLRDDDTAATVILAIAAAILARAWSSGSRSEE